MLASRAAALLGAACIALSLAAPAAQAARADDQATIDHAIGTLQDLRRDKAFGTAKDLMHRARAIVIAPRIFKAGFFFGGEGGSAVLMVRGAHGWSDPAFYSIGSASFGLQIGAQESELIMFIMSQRALDAVLRNEFKIGADAGISLATLGSDVNASTTSNLGADIIAWASSSGAYVGISLQGSVLAPDNSANSDYYGRALTTRQITELNEGRAAGASALVRALDGAG